MALTTEGTALVEAKCNELIDKIIQMIDTKLAPVASAAGQDPGDATAEEADSKLLALTVFQVYDENTVASCQGDQDA